MDIITSPGRPAPSAGGSGAATSYRPEAPRSAVSWWCIRHRWLVLALSILVLAGGITAVAAVGVRTTPAQDQLVGDSKQAASIEDRAGLYGSPTETVVVTAKEGSLSEAEVSTIGAQLTAAYTGTSGVARVGEPRPGSDGRSDGATLFRA